MASYIWVNIGSENPRETGGSPNTMPVLWKIYVIRDFLKIVITGILHMSVMAYVICHVDN